MNIVSRKKLISFYKKHADSKNSLETWFHEVKYEEWNSSHDIKEKYPSASLLGKRKIIFNIKGKKYRLVTKVNYKAKVIFIIWIGTHAEYNKKKFE